jgi:hypothetical protein
MTLAVCVIDTRNHTQAACTLQHTLNVLSRCHAAHKAYWISDLPAPRSFSVHTEQIQISPIHRFPMDYNRVCLHLVPELIQEHHVLMIQCDGYAVHDASWTCEFLNYDYVGACWPSHWHTPHAVGNGGFSLRSRKLLQALKQLQVTASDRHEDYQICLDMRSQLEHLGCAWAPPQLADQFSIENNTQSEWYGKSFGFHGKFLMSLYGAPTCLG